jgi:hypothetical protein
MHDGILHRHKFTIDGPGEIDAMFPGVPLQKRGARITQDILDNVAIWAAQLPRDDVQKLSEIRKEQG